MRCEAHVGADRDPEFKDAASNGCRNRGATRLNLNASI